MSELVFITFIILITTGLIYFLYNIMLGNEKKPEELQITSRELLEQVKILHKQKKYQIVENLAKKYLEKKFNDSDVRAILAKSLHEAGKVYESIEQAKVVAKLQPKNYDMRIFLANCYFDISKSSKAIKTLQDILEDDPNNAVALKELAEVYFRTNQKRSSIKMYKQLEEFIYSNQEKVKNKALVAQMHVEFMEYDLAIEEYIAILAIYPADISIKKRLIELFKATGDYGRLIEYCNDILASHVDDENSLWAIEKLIEANRKLEDYEKAFEYTDMMKEHPLSDKIKTEKIIAGILLEKGQIEESIELLKSLVPQDIKDVEIKKALAKSYETKQDFDSATEIYREILDAVGAEDVEQIHMEMSDLYSNWAIYLFLQNDNENCFKKFTTALQYYSDNPEVYYNLGNVNKLIKNFNEAIAQYKNAIELEPSNPDYYYALSEAYEEIQNSYEQKKALLECLRIDPANSKAHYKLGALYEQQNDINKAIECIKKALEFDDSFYEAKHKLALIQEHIGNKEEAIRLYSEILKQNPENEEILNNLKMLKAQ